MLKTIYTRSNEAKQRRTQILCNNNMLLRQSQSVNKSRNIMMNIFPNSNHLISELKAHMLIKDNNNSNNYNNTSNNSNVLSPKSKSKLKQIFLRQQSSYYLEETKQNSNKYTLTDYSNSFNNQNLNNTSLLSSSSSSSSTNHNKLFRHKALNLCNPILTQRDKDNDYDYNGKRGTSPSMTHSVKKQIALIQNEINKLNSDRNAKIDSYIKKPIANLFNLPIEKRIKSSINHLKNFKFSVDINAQDEAKHQKIIENNLTLLSQIKNKINDNQNCSNDNNAEESISIELND